MTDPHTDRFAGSSSDRNASPTGVEPQASGGNEAVFGPFTLREVVIGGSVLVIFIGSLLPFFEAGGFLGNLWNASSLFFLGVGIILPVAAAGLLAARRLGTEARVGSLSVDQFASVVAVLAAAFFFLQTVTAFHYGPFICLLGAIGMLAATVGGPHLPKFSADFAGRPTSGAHVVARSVLPVTPKAPKEPKAPKPVPAEQVTQFSEQQGTASGGSGAAVPAGAGTAGARAGNAASAVQPGTSTGRGRFGFGAATKSPSSSGSGGTPDAHRTGEVGAVPGVQDKEQPGSGSAGYPRFADEDFAPYSGSPDSVHSTDEDQPVDQVANAAVDTETANAASATDAGASSPAAEEVPVDTGRQGAVQETAITATASAAASAAETTAAATTAQPVVERTKAESQESISATREPDHDDPVVEAFWFAVGTPRPVVDEASGVELFVLRPGDWEVGIEDRGEEFLVQDKRTGRIGVMRDLTNIERAPSDG
ncbi:hypothetical protein [Arthrobacter sp. HLT1-21]